jgi:predicted dehydrogenase
MKRREFIYTAAAGIVAVTSHKSFGNISPNDKIQIGCIGVGGMGQGNMSDFLSHPDASVVAVCDVDEANLNTAAATVKEKAGKEPDKYRDFRKLLERSDIDAVMIGTPDHWHAMIAALACQAGKDVYVEKPLCHNIREGRLAVEAAKKHKRVTQLGTQVHQTQNYHKLVEVVKSGKLGAISKVRVWIAANDAPEGIGNPPDAPVPEGVDYDLWLGPAPVRPFNTNRFHFEWRYFWDYGGGTLGDMGCHIIDPVYWSLGLDHPTKISSIGGRYVLKDNAETFDTQEAVWEYDPPAGHSNKLQLVWSLTAANDYGLENRGLGIMFCGSEGTLIANYGKCELYNQKGELVEQIKPEGDDLGKAGKNHKREFLDCIKSRERCSCDIEYGHKVTTVPLTGNIAARVGRTLEWDAEKELFKNDEEANKLLTREYREPCSPKSLGIES